MPIVIAHGQPKSGSTFLFNAVQQLSELVNGEGYFHFVKRYLPEGFAPFQADISVEQLTQWKQSIPSCHLLVVKTHMGLSADLAQQIDQDTVFAFTSVRDPRDASLSILDRGKVDRENGQDGRWFASIHEIEQLNRAVGFQALHVMGWANCDAVLTIPYYMLATVEAACLEILASHIGYSAYGRLIAEQMAHERRNVAEFNKGIADRFVEELEPDQIRFANEAWAEEIQAHHELTETVMARHGYRALFHYLTGQREAALHKRLS